MNVTESYRAARDLLLDLREDPDRAHAEFTWPDVGDTFNWAVDWFDAIARGNDKPALVIVEEDGSATERSFDAMAVASDQVAAWLAGHGVRRGDAVIVMLGNQVELWETMLAVMKLGAVIMPTTTAVGPADLADRIERGGARFVVCNPVDAAKFDSVPGDYTVLTTEQLHDAYAAAVPPSPHPGTAPSDRLTSPTGWPAGAPASPSATRSTPPSSTLSPATAPC